MKSWANMDGIPMPARVARMRRDSRGYPIPHTVQIDPDGTPDFRVIDPVKWGKAARLRCCGICGEPLGVRMAFVGGPVSMSNRLFTDLPMHRDCAQYALRACPFLAAPSFAYSRKVPIDASVNEHVVTTRPDRFGIGICKGFRLAMLPGGEAVLQAAEFEHVEWWREGAVIPAQVTT